MVIQHGPQVSESSTRISKFYATTDSEHKFNKMGIKNRLPIGFNLGSSWLGLSFNFFTLLFLQKSPSRMFDGSS